MNIRLKRLVTLTCCIALCLLAITCIFGCSKTYSSSKEALMGTWDACYASGDQGETVYSTDAEENYIVLNDEDDTSYLVIDGNVFSVNAMYDDDEIEECYECWLFDQASNALIALCTTSKSKPNYMVYMFANDTSYVTYYQRAKSGSIDYSATLADK